MKKLLLAAAMLISGISFSQSNSKMDFYLATKLDDYSTKKLDASFMLPMLIKGNIAGIKQLVKQNGGIFKYFYGNIAAIIIPASALAAFNESGSVTRMEGGPPHNVPLDDSANVKNHIVQILQGLSPLPKADSGKGIAIGFVDTGIELKHDDFKDNTGTRVKFLWDQNIGVGLYTPLPWGYGQAWNKSQIDILMSIPPYIPDTSHCVDFGHGSNVAGIAVGNGTCNGQEIGGCPKADIIFVAYNFNVQGPTMFTDAVQYIYQCADSLNEPCVINASMGTYDGSHDDSDLQGEMIDNMLAAKQPGRVFVCAAGNEGVPYHVHDSLRGGMHDTTFTWFIYDAGFPGVDIPIFANENNFNNLKFRLRVDKVQAGSYTERDTFTVFHSIKDYMGNQSFDVYNKNNQLLGSVKSYESVYGNGSYSLEFQITSDSTSYYWGFESTDTSTTFSRYDIWDLWSANDVKDTDGLDISQTKYPEIKKYKQPDTLMTICSSYQCSPHVMTVQTYFNRLGYKDCNGNHEQNSNPADVPGAFVWGTSRGPTRNFLFIKPDVAASGNYTLSADPICYSVECNSGTDSLGCHNTDGGTSMASPMVASAAALYLEEYPGATDSNVMRCIISTTYTDVFTGPKTQLPNSNWGYGKLDAFAALTQCGPTDVPKISGAVYAIKLTAYPNPYSNTTNIMYDFSGIKEFSTASIVVYDMLGKAIKVINLNNNQGTVTMDRSQMASGLYFYSLMVNGLRLKTGKLEVQ